MSGQRQFYQEMTKSILKGPEDRVRDLQALRQKTLQEKSSGKAKELGYDPDARLQSIDHEIERLSRPPYRKR